MANYDGVIICPKCGAKLQDRAIQCQFCQETFDPDVVGYQVGSLGNPPKWVWIAYNGIAIYWAVSGLFALIYALLLSVDPKGNVGGSGSLILIISGLLDMVFGLGLLARVEMIRNIVVFFCGVRIILGILGFIGSIGAALIFGPLGILQMFTTVLGIFTAAVMIYLIGETEKLHKRART